MEIQRDYFAKETVKLHEEIFCLEKVLFKQKNQLEEMGYVSDTDQPGPYLRIEPTSPTPSSYSSSQEQMNDCESISTNSSNPEYISQETNNNLKSTPEDFTNPFKISSSVVHPHTSGSPMFNLSSVQIPHDSKRSSTASVLTLITISTVAHHHREKVVGPEFIDGIFTQVVGPDGHGCVRTYGKGVTPKVVFGKGNSNEEDKFNKIREETRTEFNTKLDQLIRERDSEINRRIEEAMTTMRASIRDEVLAELRGGNGPSSIGNVPTSSSVHRPDLDLDLDLDESFSREGFGAKLGIFASTFLQLVSSAILRGINPP
ncbi:hypothetical protein LguiB_012400 [Lonicera macranthoides]